MPLESFSLLYWTQGFEQLSSHYTFDRVCNRSIGAPFWYVIATWGRVLGTLNLVSSIFWVSLSNWVWYSERALIIIPRALLIIQDVERKWDLDSVYYLPWFSDVLLFFDPPHSPTSYWAKPCVGKALKIRFTLICCHLVDIRWLTEAFEGDRIWKFDVKSTDGTTIFAYLGIGGKFLVD